MKYPQSNKPKTKTKAIKKKQHQQSATRNQLPIPHEQSIHSSEIVSDEEMYPAQKGYQREVAPEDVRLDFARQLLESTKDNIRNQNKGVKQDDFFMTQPANDNEEQLVAEALKDQYLQGRNKLYNNQTDRYSSMKIDNENVVRYKGHKKCITGIEVTQETIFSCSKDKSIIKWDRETGKKQFITKGDSEIANGDHVGPILSISYHPGLSLIATGAEDGLIKLWDIRTQKNVETLKGHRGAVTGVKFGLNSHNLCSISGDRTFKQWDCAQRGLIQTFYGHNNQVLDLDCINENDFISSGNDHQTIIWKTQKQTQVIFEGHDYPIDRVRSINQQKFITACQDGSIYLWSQRKKKPIYKNSLAHDSWICSLSSLKQTNIFATGDTNQNIKIWGINDEMKGMKVLHEIKSVGIVTDLVMRKKQIVGVAGDECRLGRWWSHRVRNQIEVFKFVEI